MKPLLQENEQDAVGQYNILGKSEVIILCPHAGNLIPEALGSLGITEINRQRHIAWDIGVLDVAFELSDQIDAPVIYQVYSRLAIDCNRCLSNHELIPDFSDNIEITGNRALSEGMRQQRIMEIWQPYQTAIKNFLDKKQSQGLSPIIIDLHSFTPTLNGFNRPWHIGFLYGRYSKMAQSFHSFFLELEDNIEIGMNQPYRISDDEDYAIPVFGEGRKLRHVLIEIRQDLIQTKNEIKKWSHYLSMACNKLISIN